MHCNAVWTVTNAKKCEKPGHSCKKNLESDLFYFTKYALKADGLQRSQDTLNKVQIFHLSVLLKFDVICVSLFSYVDFVTPTRGYCGYFMWSNHSAEAAFVDLSLSCVGTLDCVEQSAPYDESLAGELNKVKSNAQFSPNGTELLPRFLFLLYVMNHSCVQIGYSFRRLGVEICSWLVVQAYIHANNQLHFCIYQKPKTSLFTFQ